jgi:branched-chain amino acid transport system ATP-binding protein
VARALATSPRLLLLDEPLAGMPPAEIEEFLSLVADVNGDGVAILLIEHNVRAVLGCCVRTYVFDYGRSIACGAADELLCDETVIQAYLGGDVDAEEAEELLGPVGLTADGPPAGAAER